jgi:hypothetical protein
VHINQNREMMENMKKRSTAVLTTMALLVSMVFSSVMAVSAAVDTGGHWAQSTLNDWETRGWLTGDASGAVRPDAGITRAEFIRLVNQMEGYTTAAPEKAAAYADLSPEAWYYNDVAVALAAGYISGLSDAQMAPQQTITRQEAMAVVAQIAGLNQPINSTVLSYFGDGASVASWAQGYVSAAIGEGFVSGYNGQVNPASAITRAETVVLLEKVYTGARTYNYPGTYGGTASNPASASQVTVAAAGVTLSYVNTSAAEIARGVEAGSVTLNNVRVNGSLDLNAANVKVSLTGSTVSLLNVNQPASVTTDAATTISDTNARAQLTLNGTAVGGTTTTPATTEVVAGRFPPGRSGGGGGGGSSTPTPNPPSGPTTAENVANSLGAGNATASGNIVTVNPGATVALTSLPAGVTVKVPATAKLNVTGSATVAGTLEAADNAELTVAGTLTVTGALKIVSGTTGGVTGGGKIVVAPGGSIEDLSNDGSTSWAWSGNSSGSIEIAAGATAKAGFGGSTGAVLYISKTDPSALVTLTNGAITLKEHAITLTGAATINSVLPIQATDTLTVAAGSILTVNSQLIVAAGGSTLAGEDSAIIVVGSSGSVTSDGTTAVSPFTTAGTYIYNNSTWSVPMPTADAENVAALGNEGVSYTADSSGNLTSIEVTSTVTLKDAVTLGATQTLEIADNAALELGGKDFTLEAGSSLDLNDRGALVVDGGATASLSGTVDLGTYGSVTVASNSELDLSSTAKLDGDGKVVIDGGTLVDNANSGSPNAIWGNGNATIEVKSGSTVEQRGKTFITFAGSGDSTAPIVLESGTIKIATDGFTLEGNATIQSVAMVGDNDNLTLAAGSELTIKNVTLYLVTKDGGGQLIGEPGARIILETGGSINQGANLPGAALISGSGTYVYNNNSWEITP